MGILKNIFGSSDAITDKSTIEWLHLTDGNQLSEMIANSSTRTQAIFKHSTRCGISRSVLRRFERSTDSSAIDFHFLDLLRYRKLSNEIASRFNIIHQSPQLIVIKDGVVAAHNSHYDLINLDLKNI